MRWTAIAASLLLLTACGTKGDFGRERSHALSFSDGIHDWMGPAAIGSTSGPTSGAPIWQHQLTDEERRLRDLAYPLIEPPYERNRWTSIMAERGFWATPHRFPERTAYATDLMRTAYRSQSARYSRLMDDIRNDITRTDAFFAVAHYVADMDRRRAKSLGHVSNLTREEHHNTVRRMQENEGIIRWVQASLNERAASYQMALERMVIAAPSPMAADAERTLIQLRERLAAHGA